MPIIDFHCDLLSYLAQGGRITDPWSRCSVSQLQQGGVETQVMAIFTKSNAESVMLMEKQKQLFWELVHNPSLPFVLGAQDQKVQQEQIAVLPAIENASGLVLESEPLAKGVQRLDEWLQKLPLLYVSLTWKEENRFGGGNTTQIGLKPDGLRFIEELVRREIPIDLSHASDALAEDILNVFIQRNWNGLVIASHSNFRAVHTHPRNLPDEFADEIVHRGGIIGLNFISPFLGLPTQSQFWNHVEYGIKQGWGDALVLGTDFFDDRATPKEPPDCLPHFVPGMENAADYSVFFDGSPRSQEDTERLMYRNGRSFFKRWRERHVACR